MDVKKYLDRIKYKGSIHPTLENLKQLCWCHAMHVPQDTLDIFGGPRKKLNLEKIYEDIVNNRRGGFCYEVNGLFHWLLVQLGYKNVQMLEGSCLLPSKNTFHYPFDHLLNKVSFDDCDYLVDVGYGAPSFFMPLKLKELCEHHEMTGTYRLRKHKDDYLVEKHRKKILVKAGDDYVEKLSKHDATNQSCNFTIDINWNIIFKFSTTPHKFEDFNEGMSKHLEGDDFLATNSFLEIFYQGGVTILWGTTLIRKKFVDELTEMVEHENMWDDKLDPEENWKVIFTLMKDEFGIKIDFKPHLVSKNLHVTMR